MTKDKKGYLFVVLSPLAANVRLKDVNDVIAPSGITSTLSLLS